MASFYLCPAVHHTWFIPGGNSPATGGQLFTYVAGSSTPQTVYKDDQGSASHTNPIVLDSGGNLPNGSEIWIPTGVTIDVVFAPSTDTNPPVSPYFTLEDLSGINDVNASASEWVTGPAPIFVSGTQFVLQGDQSATFKNGRRLRSTNTAGTIYSRITSIAAAAGSTTVNVVSDSGGALDSGLSAVSYGLLDPELTSITEYHVSKNGGTVSSAGNGTTNIWGVPGQSVHISGTNTIFSFSTASYAGATRTVIFDGELVLASSAAFLSVPSAPLTNIVTKAGDRAEVVASTAAHSVITQYQRASGLSVTESMQLIASSVAATSATIDFVFSTAAFSSFPAYLLSIVGLKPQTNSVGCYLRMSENGGSSFNASSTAYRQAAGVFSDNNNSFTGFSTVAAAQLDLAIVAGIGNSSAAGGSFCGNVYLFNPSDTTTRKRVTYQVSSVDQNAVGNSIIGQGEYASTAAYNAIRIQMSAGNINAGRFALYGLRHL